MFTHTYSIYPHYLYSPYYHKPNKDPSFYHIQHLPASLFSKENRISLLKLRFKAPQALGPFQIDRACKKIPICKIWWVFVQYTSRKSQNTSQFLWFLSYLLCFWSFSSFTPLNCSPTIVKSFQDNLFDHKKHTEHILYGYISRKHEFQRRTFSKFFWTRNGGKPKVYNSQYLACLPISIPKTTLSVFSIS